MNFLTALTIYVNGFKKDSFSYIYLVLCDLNKNNEHTQINNPGKDIP
jgi:hypothetical protein